MFWSEKPNIPILPFTLTSVLLNYLRRVLLLQSIMMAQFCSEKLEEYQKLLHLHETTMLAFCVLNLAFSFLATVENLLVIHALWKSLTVPANLKKLFVNLAFSDLAVGFFAQLMLGIITAVMVKMAANENYNFDFLCPTILTVCYSVIYFLTCVSFLDRNCHCYR